MSTFSRIPENYDLREIVEALIKELEDKGIIDKGATRIRIIEKGRPESQE
jgi:predicted DNA-binding protein